MIRCNTLTLKYTNEGKKEIISNFISRYTEMVKKFVNVLWNSDFINTKPLVDNRVCQSICTKTHTDSRIRQCAAKQASAIVRSLTSKRRKQLYKLSQLQKEGKNTKYLQRKIDTSPLTKPIIKDLHVELDSRFIDFQEGNKEFNLFVRLSQIGNKEEVIIPLKYNKVVNKWLKQGKLKSSIRLSQSGFTLYFEIPDKPKKGSKRLGADQGLTTCLTLSDGQVTTKNLHGHDLTTINKILIRKTKGSKGFKRAQDHRKNYINWSLNQLNFNDIKEVGLEKIRNIRRGKRSNRYLTHWTYTLIKDKLVRLSEDKGFVLIEQENKFMSQRCSKCGWTHKSNRKGKTFKCVNCDFKGDSDLNAASNHEVILVELSPQVWKQHLNRTSGFYWNVVGDEPIVRHVQKPNYVHFS
jgi:transposase